MGILSINDTLEIYAPNCFINIPLEFFRGLRIALDGCNYMYAIYCTARKEIIYKMPDPLEEVDIDLLRQKCIENLMRFIVLISQYGITLVWVWDGEKLNAKDICKIRRQSKGDRLSDRIKAARELLESKHPLERTQADIKAYKNILVQKNFVDRSEMNFFKNFISLLGYPSLQAPYEGEKLCANLAIEKLVAAVWSTDTDNYALGTPILISGFGGYNESKQLMVKCVDLNIILNSFDKSHKWLIDLCILHGCDFNTRMPGIGPAKSYKLMEKYDSIENIELNEPNKPINVLNYVQCREIFAIENTKYTSESPELNFNKMAFMTCIRDVAEQYNLQNQINDICDSTRYIVNPRCYDINPKMEESVKPVKKSRFNITNKVITDIK
jgi:5'-3' exonuclease